MKVINKIMFNDGYLELQQDREGNYLLCAIGSIAHKYYHKFSKITDNKFSTAFEKFNNCEIII